MRRALTFLAAITAAFAGAGQAGAGIASLTVSELPLHAERTLQAAAPKSGFDFVGLHWRGSGRVWFRVRTARGPYGGWLEAERSDGPDRRSAEARFAGRWFEGEGVWVGHRRSLQVRATPGVTRIRAFTVRSPVSRIPLRRLTAAGEPGIVPRSGWQADETIRKAEPQYADALRFAIVHHTAGANTYTREQAPAVVRAIELYHVRGNGWNDIGYNALVDRYGTVYEGRYGGLDRNVVGAHARGFNTGSFGIAVVGDFTKAAPPKAATDALARTIAWRLDLAHSDPLSAFDAVSAGNERFPPGVPVPMRGVSGHRDTGSTTCPGQKLYDLLPAIARQTATIGLPKLYEPAVAGSIGGPITFTARLSGASSWRLAVSAPDGTTTFEASGKGPTVTAVWDATAAPPGAYTWRLEGPGLTPATGTVGSTAVAEIAFTAAGVSPQTVSPDGDGFLDAARLTYTLNANANVQIDLRGADGAVVASLDGPRWRRAGPQTLSVSPPDLPDGTYELRLTAKAAGGLIATSSVPLSISHTLAAAALAATVFTPNADGRSDLLRLRYTLTQPAGVVLRILRGDAWTATPFAEEVAAGRRTVVWDGTRERGVLREGDFVAELVVTDAITTTTVRLPFHADWTPPRVVVAGIAPLTLRVSESSLITLRSSGGSRRLGLVAPGVVKVSSIRKPKWLEIRATDLAGNRAVPVRWSAH